jgi:hypothetical protein
MTLQITSAEFFSSADQFTCFFLWPVNRYGLETGLVNFKVQKNFEILVTVIFQQYGWVIQQDNNAITWSLHPEA